MATAAAAAVATPLDLLLANRERSVYARSKPPRLPIIFVVGAPRSGTTIVSQVLINALPVSYFNNLTQIFPRAPITAGLLFGRFVRRPSRPRYESYFGRTSGLAGPNGGLRLWDRWWTDHRFVPPDDFDAAAAEDMRSFFGAYEAAFAKPLLNKNNALAHCAAVVARVLPTARFVWVEREPLYNVQSIILAREAIQGSRSLPYGVAAPDAWPKADDIDEICSQVLHHRQRAREQQAELGEDRLRIVDYEQFCKEPMALVELVASEWLHVDIDGASVAPRLPQLSASKPSALPPSELDRIASRIAELSSLVPVATR